MTDWNSIKEDYISSKISLKALAKKYGVVYGTLKNRALKEGWSNDRSRAEENSSQWRMEQVTAKLLLRMEKAIDENTEMDSKEIKTMTGALKELRDIQKKDDSDSDVEGNKAVEVCFIGDAEELSQ